MTNFKLSMLVATILTSASTQALAYNENSFKANGEGNKLAIRQTGNNHVAAGSVYADGSSITIVQTGTNNNTSINDYQNISYPTKRLVNAH